MAATRHCPANLDNFQEEFYELEILLILTGLYAFWQWIRSHKIIICLHRLITGLLIERFTGTPCFRRGDGVRKIVKGVNDSNCWDDDVIPLDPADDPDNALVFGHPRHLMGDDQFLELSGGRLLFTTHSMLCSIKRLEKVKFVIEHTPVMGKLSTAREVSDEDAIILLANGHCAVECFGEIMVTSSYSDAEKNHRNFQMLATLPILLQVKGLNFEAAIVFIAILCLDLLRTPMSRVYTIWRDSFMMWAKLNVLRKCSMAYEIMSLFSNSWMYSDQSSKCVYKSKGPFYCIHGSILNKGGFAQLEDPDGLENMFRIEGKHAEWLSTTTDANLGAAFRFNYEILVC